MLIFFHYLELPGDLCVLCQRIPSTHSYSPVKIVRVLSHLQSLFGYRNKAVLLRTFHDVSFTARHFCQEY
jgi:hypothetical protein